MKSKKLTLAPVELMLMKAVWKLERATVQEVMEAVGPQRKLAYTTVLSMLRNLENKGFLTHDEEDRKYLYRPLVNEGEVTSSMLRDLLNRAFDGSKELLVSRLFELEGVDEEELQSLRNKLSEFEKNGNRVGSEG
jgi:predicted transcriptional regulator